jgi:phosphohistidine phosphatase
MDLILWRHADAGQPLDDAVLDLQRPLSPKGVKHAARMADWLQRVLPERTRVLASPALRCQQTAQALGRAFDTRDTLGPGGGVRALLALAGWPDRQRPVLIVGHQPTLGATAAWLMTRGHAAGDGADANDAGTAALAGTSDTDDAGAAPWHAPSWTIRKGAVWWLRRRVRAGMSEVVVVAVRAPDAP